MCELSVFSIIEERIQKEVHASSILINKTLSHADHENEWWTLMIDMESIYSKED